MSKKVIVGLRITVPGLILLLLPLSLVLAGCGAKESPLSPGAAAFKTEVQDILGKLAPATAGPLTHNDAKAAKQAILAIFPNAGQDKPEFPFWLGAMSKDGILLAAVPPVQAVGADFIQYQLVQETLKNRRVNKMRLYAPDGTAIFMVVAPVMLQDNVVGLVGLRVTADQALKKWGITAQEFQQIDLN